MSYYQDGIIHLPASTTHQHQQQQHHGGRGDAASLNMHAGLQPFGTATSYGSTRMYHSNYGSVATAATPSSSSSPSPYLTVQSGSGGTAVSTNPVVSVSSGPGHTTLQLPPVVTPPPNSGNLSLESRDSLLEAGELLTSTSSTTNRRRHKADIGIIFSIVSFLVWIRLFQAMFYSSVLGHLEGFAKELLFVLLVWVPSITLTCFYFRSDQSAFARFRSLQHPQQLHPPPQPQRGG